MGKLSDSALQALERRCLGWRDVYATRAHAQVRA
jgi:hypothetical protein